MAQKLTDPIIRKEAAPEKGARTLFDSEVKGFGIRLFAPTKRNPEGARSFFLNYRVDGIERRYTIGEFPTYSVKDARDEAKALWKLINSGEDPASDKRKRRVAPTVQDLLDRYVQDHLPKKACFGTWRERDERKMLDQIGDSLGRARKVADIHHADIEQLHRAITDCGHPVRANRVLAIASKAFSLALTPLPGEQEPWRTAAQGNPCKGVARNHEESRENFFSDAEIASIADALNIADERSSTDCIRLIMLTGCRPCEGMRARWPEFDAEAGFWVKPSSHTKQRKVHKVPLSASARELIDALRETRNSETSWVFPGRNRGEPVKHIRTVWRTARRRATVFLWLNSSNPAVSGLISSLIERAGRLPTIDEAKAAAIITNVALPASLESARIYDLRHTFASVGAGSGMGLPILGKLLGHSQPKTTARYSHIGDESARAATEKIGKMIASAVERGSANR
jgi:integrase